MNILKKLGILPVAAALAVTGLVASEKAEAYVYAASKLDISNLKVVVSGGGTVTGYKFTTSTEANLNGPSDGDSDTCTGIIGPPASTSCNTGVGPVLNSDAANAPGSGITRLDTDYALSANIVTDYTNSNAEISTAQLVDGVPTSALQVSEGNVVSNGSGSANTAVSSNTDFLFFLTAFAGNTVTITFDANLFETAVIDNGAGTTLSANAAYETHVTASFGGNQWSSNGTTEASACFVGSCSDTEGGAALTTIDSTSAAYFPFLNVEVGDPGSITHTTGGVKSYSVVFTVPAAIPDLLKTFTLNLGATTLISVNNSVPEPGSLALIGMGLVALGLRRRKIK